jgi:hypothetical protein
MVKGFSFLEKWKYSYNLLNLQYPCTLAVEIRKVMKTEKLKEETT